MPQAAATDLNSWIRATVPRLVAIVAAGVVPAQRGGPSAHCLGKHTRWCVETIGVIPSVEVFDAKSRRFATHRVELRVTKAPRARVDWQIPTKILVQAGQTSRVRWVAVEAQGDVPLLVAELRDMRGAVVELGASSADGDLLVRAESSHVVVAGGQGMRAREGRLEIAARVAYLCVSVGDTRRAARLRVLRARHAGIGWFEHARTLDTLWRRTRPSPLRRGDPLFEAYEVALRQLAMHDGFDWWASTDGRSARSTLSYREQLRSRAANEPSERRVVDVPAFGREREVLVFDDALHFLWVPDGTGAGDPRSAGLRAKRIPMLLDPADDRRCASLIKLGTPLRPARMTANIANNQARMLAELLRADGTLGFRGRLRAGARPGPSRECCPLATAWLARARLANGDVAGARRCLESLESVRRASGCREFAWLYAKRGVVRARDERAARAFVDAVDALVVAEQQTVAKPAPIERLPRLLYRYRDESEDYVAAFERCRAWAEILAPRFTSRRTTVRTLRTKLDADTWRAEIRRLRDLTAWIEARFEEALGR